MPSKDKKLFFLEPDTSSITFNDAFHKCQVFRLYAIKSSVYSNTFPISVTLKSGRQTLTVYGFSSCLFKWKKKSSSLSQSLTPRYKWNLTHILSAQHKPTARNLFPTQGLIKNLSEWSQIQDTFPLKGKADSWEKFKVSFSSSNLHNTNIIYMLIKNGPKEND